MRNLSAKKKTDSIFEKKTVHDCDFSLTPEEYIFLKNKFAEYKKSFTLLSGWQDTTFQSKLKSPLISYMFQSQVDNAKRIIEPSFLAILCDPNGVTASYSCSQDVAPKINEMGILNGSSFALKYAGINAISASMEYNKPVFMRYKDHSLDIFEDWACICFPIIDSHHQLLGYFDFSTYCSVDVKRYVPLCLHIAKAIGSYMPLEQYLRKKVEQLPLSDRKKEVCWLWILDYDYKQIARKLHISPNTVRVLISQINETLNVSSKTSMILHIMEHYSHPPLC